MNNEIGCTECPYAGHIELKECPDAYTEVSQYCGLYKHEPINSKDTKRSKKMDNDLISREALKKAIAEFHQKENDRLHSPLWGSIGLNALNRLIDYAPTVGCITKCVDCERVVKIKEVISQGEWIMNKTSARGRNYTCTICKKVSRNKFDFCPNCGADMSEAKNETDN